MSSRNSRVARRQSQQRRAEADAGSRHRNRWARWRAATLLLVYALMALHVAHWKLSGKTLAPLELNEVMYTLELGIVTAGFIFMAIVVLASAIFGRFFCSWGCHILALQDLSVWLLGRVGIKPRPIRSRLLLWVPLIAAGYMFVWPQVSRVIDGRPMATLHVATDTDGWASFTTENFWRNLPGPGVAIATFVVCGFIIIFVLGSRSFCAYGCPYGAVFALVDRLAPGRIRVGPDCVQCAKCTAVCSSHVRVHEEVARFGMVVNPACMKDFDCVSVCPQQTLRYGFGRPTLFKRIISDARVKTLYDFSFSEEILAAIVFLIAVLVFRGLYDLIPFLLSLALAALLSYGMILAVRLLRGRDVSVNRWWFRRNGVMKPLGYGFMVGAAVVFVFTGHSSIVQGSHFLGRQAYAEAVPSGPTDQSSINRAIDHLTRAHSWALVRSAAIESMLGDLYAMRGDRDRAELSRRRALELAPHDPNLHEKLGMLLQEQERYDEARHHLQAAVRLNPNQAQAWYGLAGVEFRASNLKSAADHLRRALSIHAEFAEALYELGAILVESGELEQGMHHLRSCIQLKPDHGDAHYNLAVALLISGNLEEAKVEIERAFALQPEDQQTQMVRERIAQMVP